MKLNYKTMNGEHCETSATGTLLSYLGIKLSEPMLFGIGEGLGFGVITFGKIPFPFIGGRIKTGLITENICKNLKLKLNQCRTTSRKKGWANIQHFLDEGQPVGLQLDSYYLDYFAEKIHFAGHFAAIVGYDEQKAYMSDSNQQGGLMTTSLESLEEARASKQPMSDKHLSYTIELGGSYDLKSVVKEAIKRNAEDFLNPPIRNFGYKGIYKMSDELKKWFKNSDDPKEDFCTMAMLMEKGGTGGCVFRSIYRDFLKEAYELLQMDILKEGYQMYEKAAAMWVEAIKLLDEIGTSKSMEKIDEASQLIKDIGDIELKAMKLLSIIE